MSKLENLRAIMAECAIDAYIQPYRNKFQSHFLGDHDQRIRYLSGFESSAGYMVITRDRAVIFYDQRYALAVKTQIDPALFETVDYHDTMPLEWISANMPEDSDIGIDPWLHNIHECDDMQDRYATTLLYENPIDMIWHDRPTPAILPAFIHADRDAGQSSYEKRKQCAQDISFLITAMDSIGWLLNIRGNDVPCMPALESFAILHPDASVDLFCEPQKIGDDVKAHLGADIRIHPFDAMEKTISSLDTLAADERSAPCIIAQWNDAIIHQTDPCQLAKSVKNDTQQQGVKAAHLRDGVAVTKFLIWAKDIPMDGSVSELDISDRLDAFRAENAEYCGHSFENIVGFAENSASIHTMLNEETNQVIDRAGMLLVDSGGQYHDGTTDVTRTLCIGDPTQEMKTAFTLALKGHIALSDAHFPPNTSGAQLDVLARQYLWANGMNYGHGTGHGVGHFGDVHEGPCGISPRVDTPLQPGMLLSIEPGYYKEGAFGLRIENLVLVRESEKIEGWLCFEPVTMAPMASDLVETTMLTPAEVNWFNAYHKTVRDALEGQLNQREYEILMAMTQPL